MISHNELANAIRALSMDAVQHANSGHAGMPMGMADIATVLWKQFLTFNPKDPHWLNRDRFVLSNGHGSMLIYSLLHLTGFDLSIDDLKAFRKLHSKTPGHPEYGEAPGVETTTGPLGQGIANAVGMAIAERALAAEFNQENFPIVNHYTYTFTGDGGLMEGISHEACSLAGTLGLGKLILFYDDNGISIDGNIEGWFTDNTPERFRSYHWHVIEDVDGHDPNAIKNAIEQAKAETDKPSIICCKTTIGFGSPNLAGSEKTHGAPLGHDEIAETRKALGWSHEPFHIPDNVAKAWNHINQGAKDQSAWENLFSDYQKQFPELAKELLRRTNKQLPNNWQNTVKQFIETTNEKAETVATRKASLFCIDAFAAVLPELLGGSADLSESNCTLSKKATIITHDNAKGNYLQYGVREFGMSAMMIGMALHGGFIPFGGTFLTFSDYARNAVRMAALMKQRVIFIYTHDSIGLGEDGPTHQAVEHAAMLRLTPGLDVWRPCDTTETAIAWQTAIENINKPTCLLLSRQGLPFIQREKNSLDNIRRGGYILHDVKDPEIIIIATGSEVSIAMDAVEQSKRRIRVVSMPSTTTFDLQDEAYRASVLPSHLKNRIAIEAGSKDFWYKYVGLEGNVIGLNRFGASAPCKDVYKDCGITVDAILNAIKQY